MRLLNNMNKEYNGVKGWLLVLCICLTILDPASAFIMLIAVTNATKPYFDQNPGLFRLILIGGICSTCLIVFSMYAGLSLWRVAPNAVTIAKRYLTSVFLYSLLSIFLPAIVGLSEASAPDMAQTSTVNNIITMVYPTLWYLYLIRSKRVKATYGGSTGQRP
ncbi:MAG: hypothetical protein A4E64_01013 [Syntrophorhabdus sp. PtaU1.Bin058]|nr:MAG: hypothetical protein A4E64_01013 [Syntrophorhabdus sp. PtaU1.Bin058]